MNYGLNATKVHLYHCSQQEWHKLPNRDDGEIELFACMLWRFELPGGTLVAHCRRSCHRLAEGDPMQDETVQDATLTT